MKQELPYADRLLRVSGMFKEAEEKYSAQLSETSRLIQDAIKKGEKGIVVKFMVEDYADEKECGDAIAEFSSLIESYGYKCCVTYGTWALKKTEDGGIETSVMRNPAIIALSIIW